MNLSIPKQEKTYRSSTEPSRVLRYDEPSPPEGEVKENPHRFFDLHTRFEEL
jgi:hypothetical protein